MYHNILVPVTMDNDTTPDRALQVAQTLAAPGARITLIHVMDEVPTYAINYLPEGYRDDLRRGIEVELAKISEPISGAQVAVIEGRAGRSILEWANDHQNDCVVIASHRPGLQDYFLGSTAARVVRHARCAVHVLR